MSKSDNSNTSDRLDRRSDSDRSDLWNGDDA